MGRHPIRNICLVNMSVFCGCRVGEISKLKLKDVVNENWDVKKEVVLRKEYTKTKKNRVIYLVHPTVRKSLEKYVGVRRKMEIVKETRKQFETDKELLAYLYILREKFLQYRQEQQSMIYQRQSRQ